MTLTQRLDLDSPRAAVTPGPRRQFASILFAEELDVSGATEPAFFHDLNLDQVVAAVTAGTDEYDLLPFFYSPLRDTDGVEYRHEVFRDLELDDLRESVRAFAAEMQRTRRYRGLASTQHYAREKQQWFLDAAAVYCEGVSALARALEELELSSRGFADLRDYLRSYTASEPFTALGTEARAALDGLSRVSYTLRIKGGRVTVSVYDGEPDHSVEVERDFERFRQGDVERHRFKLIDPGSMDHVEARIAELVARLYPAELGALHDFCAHHRGFIDATIARFDREVQFYLAYLGYSERLRRSGVAFCYPTVSAESKEVVAEEAVDLALASKLVGQSPVVANDFFLRDGERILVVTGPNQGGKTTFARMFGQLHYLASLGLPVTARTARLFLADRLFTHFDREEDIATLRGKLDDELVRVRDVLAEATSESIIILNEVFSSTTLHDAHCLGTEVLRRVVDLGALAVCVTFVDELASLGNATVSMVANVAPDDPAKRTYKIVRRPADGRAYAWALAEKYGLSHEALKRRIGQ